MVAVPSDLTSPKVTRPTTWNGRLGPSVVIWIVSPTWMPCFLAVPASTATSLEAVAKRPLVILNGLSLAAPGARAS